MAPGIHYATWSFAISEKERTTLHAFRIDPAEYNIKVELAPNEKEGFTASEMARRSGALVAVNGGFFTPEHTSIGLIMNNGKEMRPLHKTSWWSVFYIENGKPRISTPSSFKASKDISMALQVGPRLTVDGTMISTLKEGTSTRSAVGIDRTGKVVIAVTSGFGISLKELARRMSGSVFEGGLDCPDAMALDGGSSSQIYAKIGDFNLSIEGLARVTNGIVVLPRIGNR